MSCDICTGSGGCSTATAENDCLAPVRLRVGCVRAITTCGAAAAAPPPPPRPPPPRPPPPPALPPPLPPTSSPLWAVAVAVVGGAALLALIVGVLGFLWVRRRRRQHEVEQARVSVGLPRKTGADRVTASSRTPREEVEMLTRSAPALIVGADLSRYGPLACIAPLGDTRLSGQMRRFERLGGPTASRNHDVVALSIDGIAVHSRPPSPTELAAGAGAGASPSPPSKGPAPSAPKGPSKSPEEVDRAVSAAIDEILVTEEEHVAACRALAQHFPLALVRRARDETRRRPHVCSTPHARSHPAFPPHLVRRSC